MNPFTQNEIIILLLSIAIMLGFGKALGGVARIFKLPSVIGEICGGIILGPTLMAKIFPDFYQWLFPKSGILANAIDAFVFVGLVLFLLIAGLEVNLKAVMKQGKAVILLSLFNIAVPFAIGYLFPHIAPNLFSKSDNQGVLSLFIGVALSITALPVIAKILSDMKLIKTDFGGLVMVSAMINDLFGWFLFAVIIQIVTTGSVQVALLPGIIGFTVGIALLMLLGLPVLIYLTFPLVEKYTEWPNGVIVYIITLGLLCSALAEAIGIHAIFGAFIAGIAIGASVHRHEHSKDIVQQFISNVFAPLFFVSIGLKIDFIQRLNPLLTITLIALAFITKIGGAFIGGTIAGMPARRSLAVGSAMSVRGAMEIIIGMLGLQYRVICEETFVAIVTMAVVTTLFSAPLIRFFLKPDAEDHGSSVRL